MSWLFSQALVEEYSEAICSDGEQFAQLNVTPTPHLFWHNGKTMDASSLSRFGPTLRVLTADRGQAVLTSFLAAFPARTSAQQEKVPAYQERAAAYGEKWPGSFVRYDRATSSWRTAQCSLLAGLDEFSGIWPSWGSMHDGACFELAMSGPNMAAKESGLWPTPYGFQAGNGPDGNEYSTFVRRWAASHPNPAISLGTNTPAGLCLNPSFVEAQMGWPEGQTDLKPLATGKFHEWLQQHSPSSQPEQMKAAA